jgi:hypothetical protein
MKTPKNKIKFNYLIEKKLYPPYFIELKKVNPYNYFLFLNFNLYYYILLRLILINSLWNFLK